MSKIIHQGHTAAYTIEPFTWSELVVDTCTHDRERAVMEHVVSGADAYAVSVRAFNPYNSPVNAAEPVASAMAMGSDGTAWREGGGATSHTAEAEGIEPIPVLTGPHGVAEAAPEEAEAAAADMLARERERMLQEAQDAAAQCLASARQQAAALTAEAYQQGLRQGEEAARQEAVAQLSPVLSAFQQATTEVARLRATVLQQAEEDVITLAFQLARKIIQHEILEHRQVLATTLRRALAHVVEQDQVSVWVHPDDLTYAMELQAELRSTLGDMKTLTVQGDATVGRGGCIIESTLGTIDARIEAQFEELERRFRMQHIVDLEARVA